MNVLGLVRGSHGVSFVLLGIMSAPLEFYGVIFVLLRILLVFGLARWGCFISWFCGDLWGLFEEPFNANLWGFGRFCFAGWNMEGS